MRGSLKFSVMKIAMLIFTLCCAFASYPQDISIEREIWTCVVDNYKNYKIDIEAELLEYERYLIDKKYLKNSDGESYIAIYKELASKNDNTILIQSYDQFKCIKIPMSRFSDCYRQYQNRILRSDQPLAKYYTLVGENKRCVTPGKCAELLLSVMLKEDFNNHLFKMYSLYSLLMTSNAIERQR